MRILALDTCSAACSSAVWVNGAVGARRLEIIGRGHAERLMPMILETMDDAKMTFPALDFLATTIGPGTFTGLRVGLATARGLALAGGLPLVGVTTLEAVAHQGRANADLGALAPSGHGVGSRLIVALDARRGEIYVQAFHDASRPLGPPLTGHAETIAASWPFGELPAERWLIIGNGAEALAAVLGRHGIEVARGPSPGLPDAADVADLCARRYGEDGRPLPSQPPSPMYLRPSGARMPAIHSPP